MASAAPKLPVATVAELLAIPEAERFHEVIDGELVPKAMPSIRHGMAQMGIGDAIAGPYGHGRVGADRGAGCSRARPRSRSSPRRSIGPTWPGGDARRESLPELPREVPITVRPDWVCEILSPSNAHNDLVKKMRIDQRSGVPHYWVLDPEAETLTVYRWDGGGVPVGADRRRA